MLHGCATRSGGCGSPAGARIEAAPEVLDDFDRFFAHLTGFEVADVAGRLAEIYAAFRDRVDTFVFYLAWWIDEERAAAHEVDFQRRFGFAPRLHRGWIGGWKPDDFGALDRELKRVRELSARPGAPPAAKRS